MMIAAVLQIVIGLSFVGGSLLPKLIHWYNDDSYEVIIED